ncbi:MAG: efflux RND transporter periplasmic adaptor subunit [Gammaproteobacteria bacterium]|nr:efflux RND transporter periplasmic adaptor subunit [Gammaproteobacteria bacterium]
MKDKLIIPGLVVLASLFGAAVLMATSPQVEPTNPTPVPPTVRVRDIEPEPIRLRVHSQGTVAPDTQSQLIPEVSGRVTWMSGALVNGGYFEKGQTLLRLDDKDYQSSLKRARAALTRDEARYEHALFEFERMQSLEERRLASRSQMESAQRDYRVADATLEDSRANVEQASLNLERTEVKAPFTGLVRDESVDIGQLVGPGSPVATIYATDRLEVRLPIADRQLGFLNLPVGHRGELPADRQPAVALSAEYAGQLLEWTGTIVRTEAQIDTSSRMVNVVARIAGNSGETLPAVGLFVNADIEGLLVDDIVVLPRNALRNGNRVLVVGDDNRLEFRDVEPLRLFQDDVLIRAGLSAGERVCISPMQTPIDGMLVNPVGEAAG